MKLKNINLDFLLDINNRLYVHIGFWLSYYLYRVYLYINIYENTIQVQFFELFVKIFAVYVNLYILMPLFLKKQKNLYYGISLIALIILSGTLQLQVVAWMIEVELYVNFNPDLLYSSRKVFNVTSNVVSMVFLVMVAKILKDNYINQQINQALLQEKLEHELKFLKAQINPHFFFNTLNSLYALVLSKSDLAIEVIVKLSNLMSYMLYETNQDEVLLDKELEYLGDYIELEKLRFGDELEVNYQIEGSLDNKYIAPMLLIPFVENSFKHSVSGGTEKIKINILANINQGVFHFHVNNSLSPEALSNTQKNKTGGIGLKNVRRRLDLLYKNGYTLDIQSNTDKFIVDLIINLNKDAQE